MPELPEVETVVRGLRDTVQGKTIKRVDTDAPPASIEVGKSFGKKRFEQVLRNRTIERVDRRGKNILMRLSGEVTLWVHLKMTGHFYYVPRKKPLEKHDLAIFRFRSDRDQGECRLEEMVLKFNDYRRFGRLRLYDNEELMLQPGMAKLGPEPLEMTADEFVELCHRSSRMIKPALLDQSFVVGIGNIYADESLHAVKLHPRRVTSSVSRKKLVELHGVIQKMLKKAIRNMGTSVDSYAGVNGQPGGFQKYLKAYGREGEPCGFCDRPLIREKIGTRSAHYCPKCQREPR